MILIMRCTNPALIVLITALWFLFTSLQSYAGYGGTDSQSQDQQSGIHSLHHSPSAGKTITAGSSKDTHSSTQMDACCFFSQDLAHCAQNSNCETYCPSTHLPVFDTFTISRVVFETDNTGISGNSCVTALLQIRFYPPDTPPP